MKKILIYCAIFAAGAAVGALITNKIVKQYYADIAQEEIDSVIKYVEEKDKEIIELSESTIQYVEEIQKDKNDLKPFNSMTAYYKPNENERAKINYNLIGKVKKELGVVSPSLPMGHASEFDGDPLTDDEYEARPKDLNEEDTTDPYEISDEEFSEECDHHSKVTLYYYTIDGVVCDESEVPIDDIDKVIGLDSLDLLDTASTVWVRNRGLSADYEVVKIVGSYETIVSGLPPVPPNKIRRPYQ